VPQRYHLKKGITAFADGFTKAQEELVVYYQLKKVLWTAALPPCMLFVGSKHSWAHGPRTFLNQQWQLLFFKSPMPSLSFWSKAWSLPHFRDYSNDLLLPVSPGLKDILPWTFQAIIQQHSHTIAIISWPVTYSPQKTPVLLSVILMTQCYKVPWPRTGVKGHIFY